jgi:hypothetical protein
MPDTETLEALDICEAARKCWRQAMEREHEIREAYTRRLKFRAGDQWDAGDISARGQDRPAIVVNLLEQPVQQVINQNLLNRPGGQVSPADDAANADVAEYLEGRIRHVEYASDCQVAYGTAIGYVAAGGFGFVGLTVDYVSPDSLEQEVRIRTIDDPASWAVDRTAKEPDGRDMRWAIGRQKFSVEEFRRRWPDAAVVDASFYGQDATYSDWGNGTDVWVGEYWRLDYRKRRLQRFSDGSSGFVDDKQFLRRLAPGVQALPGEANTREVEYPCVTQYLVSGAETLDETPWPGTRIPIYEVVATEFYADGKRIVKSLISDALPSQQTYNCSESLKLEAVVLAPKPKWLVTSEQISGHEQMWKTANTSTDAALFYNGLVDSRGNPVPPPDWKVFVPPVQEFTFVSNQAKEDVKATTGFFDPALGALDPQRQSGKAILALQQQTGMGTAHYAENLSRALKALYQDIIDIDLKLNRNSGPKQVRVTLPNGKHQLVRINDPDALKQLLLEKGRYEVVVSVGPSFRTQREAATAFIETIAARDPQGWALIRDLGARIKEPELGHYADEIATRWTPPQFAEEDPNAPPLPPGVQQQLALVPQLTQRVNELTQIIEQKKIEEQGKYQRDMAVEQQKFQTEELKSATQIRVAELNAKNDQLLAMMDARVKELERRADRVHEATQQAHKHAHEAALAAQSHAHSMHQSEAQNENQTELAENGPLLDVPAEAGGQAGETGAGA